MSETQFQDYISALNEAIDRNQIVLSEPDMDIFYAIRSTATQGAGDALHGARNRILISGTAKATPEEIRNKYAGRGF